MSAQGHRQLGRPEVLVGAADVGPHERCRRRPEQDDRAPGLGLQEGANGRRDLARPRRGPRKPPAGVGRRHPNEDTYARCRGPSRYSRVAVTALLNGVAGLVLVPFGCSLAAIVFGMWGRRRVESKPELKGRGLATAGIWLGALGLVVATVATARVRQLELERLLGLGSRGRRRSRWRTRMGGIEGGPDRGREW